MPLLFPGVKGEAISRSALGARAGLSGAIPKVEGGCAVEAAVQQADVEEVAVLGGNGARGEEEGRGTSRQVGRKHQELRCKSISTHLLSQDFGAVRLEHHGLGAVPSKKASKKSFYFTQVRTRLHTHTHTYTISTYRLWAE